MFELPSPSLLTISKFTKKFPVSVLSIASNQNENFYTLCFFKFGVEVSVGESIEIAPLV
jgi:hypothetical protein